MAQIVGGVAVALTAKDELTKRLIAVEDKLKKMGDRATGAKKKIDSLGGAMKGLKNAMLAIGGIAIFGSLLKEVGKVERAFIDLKNVASDEFAKGLKDPLLKQRMGEMKDGINKLSTATGKSRQALSEMAVGAAKMGISIKNGTSGMLGYLETLTKIQQLEPDFGGGNAEAASLKLAKTATILKVPLKEMQNYGSALSMVASAGTSSADELTNILLRIGSSGKLVGATTQELIGLSGTLVDMGIREEMGGTAVSKVLTAMQTGTADFKNELSKLDPQLAKTFEEQVKTNGVQALRTFSVALNKLNKEDRLKMLDKLKLDAAGMSNVLLGLADNIDKFDSNIAAANRGYEDLESFNKKYLATLDGVEAKMNFVGNGFKNLGLDIVEKMIPAIVQLMTALQVLMNSPAFTKTFDSLLAGISFLVEAFTKYAIPALEFLFGKVLEVFDTISGGISAIIDTIINVRGDGMGDMSGTIKDFVDGAVDIIKMLVQIVVPIIQGMIVYLKFIWDEYLHNIVDMLSGVISIIKGLLKVLTGNFEEGFATIWEGWVNLVNGTIDLVVGWVVSIVKVIGKIAEGVFIALQSAGLIFAGFAGDVVMIIGRMIKRVIKGFGKIVIGIMNWFSKLDIAITLNGILDQITEWGRSLFESVKDIAKKAWSAFTSLFGGGASEEQKIVEAKKITKKIKDDMKPVIKEAEKQGESFADTLAEQMDGEVFRLDNTKAALSVAGDMFAEFFAPMTKDIKGVNKGMNETAGAIKGIGEASDTSGDEVVKLTDSELALAKSLYGGDESVSKGAGKAKESSKEFTESFRKGAKDLDDRVKKLGDGMSKFKDGVVKAMGEMEDGITKTKDKIKDLTEELNKALKKAGIEFADDLVGDKAGYLKDVQKLEGELEGIKKYGKSEDGSVSDSEVERSKEKLTKIMEEQNEKQKAILKSEREAYIAGDAINANTKSYLQKLYEVYELKQKIAEIDEVIKNNFKEGDEIDFDKLLKDKSLDGAKKREFEYKKKLDEINAEKGAKIRSAEELLKVQLAMEDALLHRRFLNEEQLQRFRTMMNSSNVFDNESKQEAIRLAEKLKALGDEKENVEKINREILLIKESMAKRIEELDDKKNAKTKKALADEIKLINDANAGYEKLAIAKSILLNGKPKVEQPKAQTAEEKPLQEKLAEEDALKTQYLTSEVEKTKEATKSITQSRKTASADAINASNEQTAIIRGNLQAEMNEVSSLISYYHRLAAAKASAGYYNGGYTGGRGFASGGYTGSGGLHDIAGVVHKGEYVIPNKVLRRLGNTGVMGMLERMRRGFYVGGYTSGTLATISAGTTNTMNINQTVNDYWSAEVALRQLNDLYRKTR